MKLGTLRNPSKRDGDLIVVHRDLSVGVSAAPIAPSLREAIENWKTAEPKLRELSDALHKGKAQNTFPIDQTKLHSPLPRAFQWVDGSAFLYHVQLVRKARNAPMPESLYQVPLMYQGGSDDFLAPREAIPQVKFEHGTDFEGEVAVIVDDVPIGVTPDEALKYIKLFMIVNDVSLRGLIPEELGAGFGFLVSKPSSSFAPFAVTADELGSAWKDGRLHLNLDVKYNGQFFGNANAGAMHFHFGQLIAHAAQTRALRAGTIVGSGTVSNEDRARGSSCLAERRMIEQIFEGGIKTPFMKAGDRVTISMKDIQGSDIFGTIDQVVETYQRTQA